MGSSEPLHEFMYWEHQVFNRQKNDIDLSRMMQGVRHGDWKAVVPKPGEPLELYNLKEDISESRNVATANPDVVAKIQEYLKTAAHRRPAGRLAGPLSSPHRKDMSMKSNARSTPQAVHGRQPRSRSPGLLRIRRAAVKLAPAGPT